MFKIIGYLLIIPVMEYVETLPLLISIPIELTALFVVILKAIKAYKDLKNNE